ncbi:hypothetical protein BHM03_00029798 [Ensete ventricosum]|nr:hypothetical protein BHM03_00029798 [Ensete ventricosum]
MTDADLTAKSSHLRTSGSPTWPTRRSWPTGCTEDPGCRTADLTQVRSAPPTCRRTPHHQDGRPGERCGGMVKGAAAWFGYAASSCAARDATLFSVASYLVAR